jgi:hypothetical protein
MSWLETMATSQQPYFERSGKSLYYILQLSVPFNYDQRNWGAPAMTNRICPYGLHHKKCYFMLAKMSVPGRVYYKVNCSKITETFSLPLLRYLLFFRFLPFFVSFFLSSLAKSAAEETKNSHGQWVEELLGADFLFSHSRILACLKLPLGWS